MKIIVSGCSGAGKSTLVAELARRGLSIVPEPGLRIVRDPQGIKPWDDPRGFARQAVELALADLRAAPPGIVVFDRGLGDALAAWQHATGQPHPQTRALKAFAAPVFMAPPWPEIHEQTLERPHDLAQAMAEYDRLCAFYPAHGLPLVTLPRAPVAARADFVMVKLGLPRQGA